MAVAYPPISLPGLQIFGWLLLWRLAHRPKPYVYLYEALLSWNLLTTYWLCLTALSAPNFTEALLSLTAGALAILVNPLLMLLPFVVWRLLLRHYSWPQAIWLHIPLWIGFEYLHFRWELTWSWLTVGFSWSEWPLIGHLATWWGPVGLSAWTLIAAAFWQAPPFARWRYVPFWGWTIGLPLLAQLYQPFQEVQRRTIYLIQPNIDPYTKFQEFPAQAQLDTLLSHFPDSLPPGSLIIGPETALPIAVSMDDWRKEPWLQPFIERAMRYKTNILLGIVGYRRFRPLEAPVDAAFLPDGEAYQSYNAAILIRPDTAFFHIKGRLVPFVERVPYLERLTFLRGWEIDLGGGFGSFGKPLSPPRPLPLYPDNVPLTVGVCYESIFTHDLRQRKGYLLAIVTNDGWWKKSAGYYQHLSYGRLTAQSLGLPMARSANTGVSGLISPKGHLLAALPYDQSGQVQVLADLGPSQTLYAIYGEWGVGMLCTFACLVWMGWWYPSRRWKALFGR